VEATKRKSGAPLGKINERRACCHRRKHEQLVGMLQEKYGIAKEEAKRQVHEFKKITEQLKKSNGKLMKFQKSPSKKVKLNREPVDAKRVSKKRPTQRKVSV